MKERKPDGSGDLREVEARFARARARLDALRCAAIDDFADLETYDPEAYDQAVRDYRRAKEELLATRRDYATRDAGHAQGITDGTAVTSVTGSGEGAPDDPPSVGPTPRLLFARWLVETGRLSEGVESAGVESAGVEEVAA